MSLNQQHLWVCPCQMCPCPCLVKIHFLKQMATAILLSVTNVVTARANFANNTVLYPLHFNFRHLPESSSNDRCRRTSSNHSRGLFHSFLQKWLLRVVATISLHEFCAIWKSVCSLLVSKLLLKFPKISYCPLLWINLMRCSSAARVRTNPCRWHRCPPETDLLTHWCLQSVSVGYEPDELLCAKLGRCTTNRNTKSDQYARKRHKPSFTAANTISEITKKITECGFFCHWSCVRLEL